MPQEATSNNDQVIESALPPIPEHAYVMHGYTAKAVGKDKWTVTRKGRTERVCEIKKIRDEEYELKCPDGMRVVAGRDLKRFAHEGTDFGFFQNNRGLIVTHIKPEHTLDVVDFKAIFDLVDPDILPIDVVSGYLEEQNHGKAFYFADPNAAGGVSLHPLDYISVFGALSEGLIRKKDLGAKLTGHEPLTIVFFRETYNLNAPIRGWKNWEDLA